MAGSMAGLQKARTADVFCEQVRAATARSKQRGRVAIVITDNLRTHTAAGSLLVRSLLSEFKDHLYLVYTPAYDPDANRIEWHGPRLATSRDAQSSPEHVRAATHGCGEAFSGADPHSQRDPSAYWQSVCPRE
jgi:DDE superfamily endonuclease